MRRLISPAALAFLLVVVVTVPAAADKAKSLYSQGQDAEARQNYEAAYDFYRQAYELKPKDLSLGQEQKLHLQEVLVAGATDRD